MACVSVVRKLITILTAIILFQRIINGQYVIYDEEQNQDLPDLYDSIYNSSEILYDDNNYIDFKLKELEYFDDFDNGGRQFRNTKKTKDGQYCIAIFKKQTVFKTPKNIQYLPGAINEYTCEEFDPKRHNHIKHKGICIIPEEHCKTNIEKLQVFRREINASVSGWFFHQINKEFELGCTCHNRYKKI